MCERFEWELRAFADPHGREGVVRLYEPRDHGPLLAMYAALGADDGRAGRGEAARCAWMARLAGRGINAVGSLGGALAGHAVLLPDGRHDCEIAVFVHPDFRRLGLGAELVRGVLGFAAECGFRRVWSAADTENEAAARLAGRTGFAPRADGRWWTDLEPLPLYARPLVARAR
ncbi:MAG TPA: GNAT family N-acetyltransferase [Longimicrobium sp.]|jgi:GNAT superfamily N-acetyltransferase